MQSVEEQVTQESVQSGPSLWSLFTTFVRISTTSFGGSTQAWVHRSIVENRAWMDNDTFLTGLTIAQIMPGANPVNIALYVGQRLRGAPGAVAAACGMIMPAFCVVLIMAALYAHLARYPLTHFLLIGIAAAGVGATIAAGIKVGKRIERRPMRIMVGVAAFVAVGILHWPMVPVVIVLAPLSVLCTMGGKNG